MTETVIHSFQSNQTQVRPSIVPAVLTVLVHIMLIGVLYVGMTLQTQQPTEVEIWDGAGLAAANNSAATSGATPTIDQPINPAPQPIPQPTVQAQTPSKATPLPIEPIQEKPTPADINAPTVTKKTVEKSAPTAPVATVTPEKIKTAPKTESKPSTNQPTTPAVDSAARTAALARMNAGSATSTAGNNNENIGQYLNDLKSKVRMKTGTRSEWSSINARFHVLIDPAGNVRPTLIKPSGRSDWDSALMNAIRNTKLRTPVPGALLKSGTDITFYP